MKNYIPQLDGLRGICALMIVWVHFPLVGESLAGHYLKHIPTMLHLDYIGVDVFFVLSGFLITRILFSEKGSGSLKHFYYRRSLRIFPVFYMAIIAVAIFKPDAHLPWCASYLSNYYFAAIGFEFSHPLTHSWSLAVEEHFYLVWPLLVYSLPVWRVKQTCQYFLPAIALLSSLVAVLVLPPVTAKEFVYLSTSSRMLSLSLGAVIALHEPWFRQSSKVPLLGWALFTAGAVFMAAGNLVSQGSVLAWAIPLVYQIGGSALSLGVVLIVLRSKKILGNLLSSKPLRFSGRISYGLYVYHHILIYFFHPVPGAISVFDAVFILAAILGLTLASYYLIERPMLRLKDRFISIPQTCPP